MSRREISKLVRRIFVLAVLTTGLALSSSGLVGNTAGAAICCNQCYVNFDNCLNGCGDQKGNVAPHKTPLISANVQAIIKIDVTLVAANRCTRCVSYQP